MNNVVKKFQNGKRTQLNSSSNTNTRFSPEFMSFIKGLYSLIPGMNTSSNKTVGNSAKEAGISATKYKQLLQPKQFTLGEMHTMTPDKTHLDPITKEVVIDSYKDTGPNGSGAMSGRDALLGPAFDLFVGSKGLSGISKASKFLYNNGKIILKTIPIKDGNFYRTVSKEAIDDAVNTGVVRGSKLYKNTPYFSPDNILIQPTGKTRYVIEGTSKTPVKWTSPYTKDSYTPIELLGDTKFANSVPEDFLKVRAPYTAGEAIPWFNGSTQVPTTGFSYWKKYPVIGWRKYSFKQGGLIRKMLTASGGPIHYSRTMTTDNLSKAANYVGNYILKGLGAFGKIMAAPLTGGPLGPTTVVLPKTKKLLDAERKITETQELLIGKASTWLSPLNYGAALWNGHGLNAKKGEKEVASWSPAWQAIGRLGEFYVGPKAVKGVKSAPKTIINTTANIKNNIIKSLISKEFNFNKTNAEQTALDFMLSGWKGRYLSGDNYYHGTAYSPRKTQIPRGIYGGDKFFASYGEPWAERTRSLYLIEIPANQLGELPLTNMFGIKTGYNVKLAYKLMKGLENETMPKELLKNILKGKNLTTISRDLFNTILNSGEYKVYHYPTLENPGGIIEYHIPSTKFTKGTPSSLNFFDAVLKKLGGMLELLKNGSGIHIKKKNRGKFTSYCGGKVTDECIRKAKASGNPTLVKRATFALNARRWKHKSGGKINSFNLGGFLDNAYNSISSAALSDVGKGLFSLGKGLYNINKSFDSANNMFAAIDAQENADKSKAFAAKYLELLQAKLSKPDLTINGSPIHTNGVNASNEAYNLAINTFNFDRTKYNQMRQLVSNLLLLSLNLNASLMAGGLINFIGGVSGKDVLNKKPATTNSTTTNSTTRNPLNLNFGIKSDYFGTI